MPDKDPMKQLQGKISRAKGKHFEARLDASFWRNLQRKLGRKRRKGRVSAASGT